jgi:ABC-type phosphate transport system permease subunit
MQGQHTDQAVGTVIGTVLGFFQAIHLAEFSNELQTAKLAAIGAAVGFVVTTLLKWMKNKIQKRTS